MKRQDDSDIRYALSNNKVSPDGRVFIRRGQGQGPIPLIKNWTAADVLWGLIETKKNYAWINIPEFRIHDGRRSIDLLSIGAGEWGGNGQRIGHEIKVSKSDFASELRKPAKYLEAMRYCDQYFYVAPRGIVDPHKLPPKAGLIEIYQDERPRWIGRWREEVVVQPATNEPLNTREFIKALASIAGTPKSYRGIECLGETDSRPADLDLWFGDKAPIARELIAQAIQKQAEAA